MDVVGNCWAEGATCSSDLCRRSKTHSKNCFHSLRTLLYLSYPPQDQLSARSATLLLLVLCSAAAALLLLLGRRGGPRLLGCRRWLRRGRRGRRGGWRGRGRGRDRHLGGVSVRVAAVARVGDHGWRRRQGVVWLRILDRWRR